MHKESIYTVGGTVQASSGTYLVRSVDDSLLELCQRGEFGFVLTARQMGKSSLMVRTAEQLQRSGVRSVMIDLSQIGVQLTDEAWYLGMLTSVEDQLDLETDLFEWWESHSQLGFGQRLSRFFESIVLKEIAEPIVVFVDEIDSTLSLDFTDDFFAAIRSVYNARTQTPDFKRLSFVLIGVATPNDLITDPSRTPFNIGHQVDVEYFTEEEAAPLAEGFQLPPDQARTVLRWVLEWTGGHPYLTQRLCSIIAVQATEQITQSDVHQIVKTAFFGESSEQDSNLRFVHDMLTRRSDNPNEVLLTYQKVLQGRAVQDDRQSHTITHMKLSGIVVRKNGRLEVSNSIYKSVFDREWLKRQWPEHWLRRVPPAVRGVVAASFVAIILFSLLMLQMQANRQAEEEAALQTQIAEAATLQLEAAEVIGVERARQAIVSDSLRNEAQQAQFLSESLRDEAIDANLQLTNEINTSNTLRQETADVNAALLVQNAVRDSLLIVSDSLRMEAQSQVLATRQARLETLTLALANASQRQVRLGNPVLGALLARQAYLFSLRGEGAYSDAIYDALVTALNEVSTSSSDPAGGPIVLGALESPVRAVAMSADAVWIAAGQEDGEILLVSNLDDETRRTESLQGHNGAVRSLIFSPTDNVLISAGDDRSIRIWQLGEEIQSEELGKHDASVWALALSPDGRRLASGGADRSVRIWDLNQRIELAVRQTDDGARVRSLAFSPDGKQIAIGDEAGFIHLWNADDSDPVSWNTGQGRIQAIAFHPGGQYLVSGGDSTTVRQWILASDGSRPSAGFIRRGHEGSVNTVAISADGTHLSSGSSDHSIQVWNLDQPESNSIILQDHGSWIWSLSMNSDGSSIVSGSDDRTVRLWNLDIADLTARVCFASSGTELTASDWDNYIGFDFDYMSEYMPCSDSPQSPIARSGIHQED